MRRVEERIMTAPLREKVLAAYGGEARWLAAKAVEATVSSGGLAYWMKGRRPVHRLKVRAEISEPRVRFGPVDRHGNFGVLDGQNVWLETKSGSVICRRDDARQFFPGGRRRFWWDALDQTYFAGYALWNYLTFPALLLRHDISWTPISSTVLEAFFQPTVPTHCEVQRFHFDHATHLLRRHDYTAEIFGAWADAANVVLEHAQWEGIPYPSRRQVTPRHRDGRPQIFSRARLDRRA